MPSDFVGRIAVPVDSALEYKGGDMTLSAWVYVNSSETTGANLISKPWNGNGYYNYRLLIDSQNQLIFRLRGDSDDKVLETSHALSSGAWHQIVATVDSARLMTVYVDGQYVASDTHVITDWERPC